MKKSVFFILQLFIIILSGISVHAISPGDYVYMGSKDEQRILWRCINVSDKEVYLLSDKVLYKRPFDTTENGLWSESDIRKYLNNDFLNAFTEAEKNVIQKRNIKSIGNSPSIEKEHIYNDDFISAVQNAGTAYSIDTRDMVFIPSIEEIQSVYTDISVFGPDYYMGSDGRGNYLDYFLRDSLSFSKDYSLVRCVMSQIDIKYSNNKYTDKLIRYKKADSTAGIRPAICLASDIKFSLGDGSKDNPYTVAENLYCTIEYSCKSVIAGTDIIPNVRYGLLNESYDVKYFCNNKKYDEGSPCTVKKGINQLYAVIYDIDGKVITVSDTLYITGLGFEAKKTYLSENFEGSNTFDKKFSGYKIETGDSIEKITLDDEHGSVLSFSAHSANTFLNSKTFNDASGIFIIQTDFMLCDWNFDKRPLFYISAYKNSIKSWLSPVIIYPDKTLVLNGTDNGGIVKSDVEINEWYTVTLIFDIDNNRLSLALDGEVLVENTGVANPYDYLSYLNIAYTTSGVSSKMYFDNMKIYTSNESKAAASVYGEPYYSSSEIKTLDYSTLEKQPEFISPDSETSFAKIINTSDEKHQIVAHLRSVGNGEKAMIRTKKTDLSSLSFDDAIVLEFDFKILKMDTQNSSIGTLSYRNPSGTEITWKPLCFENDGSMYISQSIDYDGSYGSSRIKVHEFRTGKWHNVKYLLDIKKHLVYVYFDDILYGEIDCGHSRFSGSASRVFDEQKSGSDMYMNMQAESSDVNKTVEFYIGSIMIKTAKSPLIYNLKYENNGKEILSKLQIKDYSLLKLSADIVNIDDNLSMIAALYDQNEKLDKLYFSSAIDNSKGYKHADVSITQMPEDIYMCNIRVFFWNIDELLPYYDGIILN